MLGAQCVGPASPLPLADYSHRCPEPRCPRANVSGHHFLASSRKNLAPHKLANSKSVRHIVREKRGTPLEAGAVESVPAPSHSSPTLLLSNFGSLAMLLALRLAS